MTTRACDRIWEVDALRERRLTDADAESFDRHRRACAECRARFDADERLRELARALGEPAVDDLHVKRMRARILRDADAVTAEGARPARGRVIFALVAAAVAMVALVVWNVSRTPAPRAIAAVVANNPPSATVTAEKEATYRQQRTGPLESVRLVEGTITISVPRREPGERFMALLPDGEIEVRGTIFTVTVERGKTLRVRVQEGVVALRLDASDEVVLRANEEWARPVVSAKDAPPIAAPPRAATPTINPPSNTTGASPIATAPDSNAYANAMALYRGQRWDDAARAFHAFAAEHPRAPEAEDAAFLEAASLARAGRADAAAVVAERFLEHHPRSFHAKDAALLVARAARDRGDCAKARRVAAPWTSVAMPPEWRAALGTCAP